MNHMVNARATNPPSTYPMSPRKAPERSIMTLSTRMAHRRPGLATPSSMGLKPSKAHSVSTAAMGMYRDQMR